MTIQIILYILLYNLNLYKKLLYIIGYCILDIDAAQIQNNLGFGIWDLAHKVEFGIWNLALSNLGFGF
jgi:hypothetical protein